MRFTVPQFIDYEPKVVGPFTFKQFVYIGLAGAVCFVLYFSFPFSVFLIASITLMGSSLLFAFLKVGGRSLITILGNFLKFTLTPKIYIWRKKEMSIQAIQKIDKSKQEVEEELPLKIAEKSQLKKLSTKIETKTR